MAAVCRVSDVGEDMGVPRNVDPYRLVAARLSGVAAAVAQVARVTTEQGLTRVAAILTEVGIELGSPAATVLLTEAVEMYRDGGEPGGPRWWYPAAREFLVMAGADLDAYPDD
jgi:hypothetical protein